MQRFIKVKNQFDATHNWPLAPEEELHLRELHRHTFYIETMIGVEHNDRELEFFMVKDAIKKYIDVLYGPCIFSTSCEQIAENVIQFVHREYGMRYVTCEVSEDQQNSAVIVHFGRDDNGN